MTQTEFSYFWDNLTLGDASLGAHASDVMAAIWAVLFQDNSSAQGVIATDHASYSSQLAVTNPAGNNIRVANGAAIVRGRIYKNTANVDETIITPTLATRIDRVVLRTDFSAQTIRIAIRTGTPGAGAPALVQNLPSAPVDPIWEVPLAQISITTGAVITLTDERVFAKTKLRPNTSETFTVIEEFTSTGVELVADFQNIPQTFKDLFILGMCRHIDNTGVGGETEWAELAIRINNDVDIDAYYTVPEFNRVSTAGAKTFSMEGAFTNPFASGYYVATDDAPANQFSPVLVEIPDYTDTDFYKVLRAQAGVWGGVAGRPSAYHITPTTYRKITGITRLEIYNGGAPLVAWATGTKFALIGVQ